MDFKSQATKLYQFLKETKALWDDEVLDSYPDSLNKFKQVWIDHLWNLPIEDWHQLDCHLPVESLKNTSLQEFLDRIHSLTRINQFKTNALPPLEPWAFTDVKFKKKHEINSIAPILIAINQNKKISKIIDIGGGVGHLSRVLTNYYGLNTVCIDKEINFQNSGKIRLKKYPKKVDSGTMEFLNITFGNSDDEHKLKSIMDANTFTIGLHTCGALSNILINTSLKYQTMGLLSFGCCYHKLHPTKDFPLSNYYIEQFNLELNKYSNTLASRAHCAISIEDFKIKYQVKNYRQGLHLFLYHKLNITNCFDVGEMHVREYSRPFEEYVKLKLEQLKIEHSFSPLEIKEFYNEDKIQFNLKAMFICCLIRWQIGRALELYLLLDRAIYLEENKYTTILAEFFSENISPRNIGILATRT